MYDQGGGQVSLEGAGAANQIWPGGGAKIWAHARCARFFLAPLERGAKSAKNAQLYQFYDRMNIFIKNAQGEQMISEGQKNP